MNLSYIFILFVINIFNISNEVRCNDLEDEISEDFYMLPSGSQRLLDPNDMLGQRSQNHFQERQESFLTDSSESPSSDCHYESQKINSYKKELELCSSQNTLLESRMQGDKEAAEAIFKKISDDQLTDVGSFYARILHKFFALLHLEDIESITTDEDQVVIQRLTVKTSKLNLELFEKFFEGKHVYHEIDFFFQNNFESEPKPGNNSNLKKFMEFSSTVVFHFYNYETWLNMLWILMAVVGFWAFCLFIVDIQRELRWKRVLCMMVVLCVIISCIVHWRHMVKVRESRRQSFLVQSELSESISHCKEEESLWDRLRRSVLGGVSQCDKYHENLMISAFEEISPLMAISETFSQFFLLPARHLGLNFGLFFKNFYEHIPLFWQIQASVLFIIILLTLILVSFGYGIYFPFWLGGIHPSRKDGSPQKFQEMIRESEERMKSANAQLLLEAKEMLSQISEVTLERVHNTQAQTYVQPVINSSVSSIARKLEELISESFAYRSSTLPIWNAEERSRIASNGIYSDHTHETSLRDGEFYKPNDSLDGKLGYNNDENVVMLPTNDSRITRKNKRQQHFQKKSLSYDDDDFSSLMKEKFDQCQSHYDHPDRKNFISKVKEVMECDNEENYESNSPNEFLNNIQKVMEE